MPSCRLFCRLVPLLLVALALAGCGNKGDLIKPSAPEAKPAPPAASTTQPAGEPAPH